MPRPQEQSPRDGQHQHNVVNGHLADQHVVHRQDLVARPQNVPAPLQLRIVPEAGDEHARELVDPWRGKGSTGQSAKTGY